jgi:hypothetical protein
MRLLLPVGVVSMLAAAPASAADPYYPPPLERAPTTYYAPVMGDVSLSFGVERDLADPASFPLMGNARAAVPLARWTFMADLQGATSFGTAGGQTLFGAHGHFYKVLPNASFGLFGGLLRSADPDFRLYTIGVEGTWDAPGNFVLGGQASISARRVAGGALLQAKGWVDYYFHPDAKLTGSLQLANYDPGAIGRTPRFTVAAEYTRRITGTAFSWFVNASYTRASAFTTLAALVGGTFNFDPPGTTLYDHDRAMPYRYTITPF